MKRLIFPRLSLNSLAVLLLLLLTAACAPVPPPSSAAPIMDMATGWQYRWGDSPVGSDGVKTWLHDAPSDPGWQNLEQLSQLGSQRGERILWLRVRLPAGPWRDPAIFMDSVDQGLEAYLGEKLIYSAGLIDRSGNEPALGTIHHMIHLPTDFAGQTLSLRFYSQYNTIGPRTGVFLGEHADHLLNILYVDIDRFILGNLLLVISLVALVLFIGLTDKKAYLAMAVFSAAAGTFIIFRTQLVELFVTSTFIQEYSKLASVYLLPVGLAAFFEQVVTPGPWAVIRRLWQVHLGYTVAAIGLALLGVVQLLNTVLPYEVLVAITLVTLVTVSARESLRGNIDARLFTLGYAIVLVFGLLEIIDDLGGIDLPRRVIHWGVLGFVAVLVLILVRRFNQAVRARAQLITIQRELNIAHRIQQNLLPPSRPDWPTPDVVCFSTPAHDMGGDLYAYHAFDRNHIALTVGDVSGKGMPAALLMAVSLASLRAAILNNLAPGELLVYLDHVIGLYTRATWQNCAMCYVEIVLDHTPATAATLRAANAGCIPPIIRRDSGAVEWLDIGGVPLGVGLGAESGYTEAGVSLSRGDMVILTSDGVVEAQNGSRELFGFDRLERAIAGGPTTNAGAMLTHLQQHVARFTGHTETHDDITIVVVQV